MYSLMKKKLLHKKVSSVLASACSGSSLSASRRSKGRRIIRGLNHRFRSRGRAANGAHGKVPVAFQPLPYFDFLQFLHVADTNGKLIKLRKKLRDLVIVRSKSERKKITVPMHVECLFEMHVPNTSPKFKINRRVGNNRCKHLAREFPLCKKAIQ